MDDRTDIRKYSTQKAMQEYAPKILQRLPLVDRAENMQEMQEQVQEMLKLLSKCGGADRVFMFDKITGGSERYERLYEYCAPGMERLNTMEVVESRDIPNWLRLFKEGQAVVIRDLEKIRDSMPKEYELLRVKGVRRLVIAPLYSRNEIRGFIGMDNPYEDVSELFIQQLADSVQ